MPHMADVSSDCWARPQGGLGCGEPLDHQHFVNSHLISSRHVLTLIIWMSERSEYFKKEFEYFEKEFEYFNTGFEYVFTSQRLMTE